MPKFVIERNIPDAGKLTTDQLASISKLSCSVLASLGPQIQWQESFVTDHKVYCVYISPDEETIREHARIADFPANSVQAIRTIIDPTTAG